MSPIRRNAGFSLVEMAVVLVIAGLILGTVIGAMNVQVTGQRIKQTQERQQVIKEALINYIRQNSRLPCPADITAGLTGANAGEVPADCATSTIAVSSGAARMGAIPWKTLGLNAESAQDAYGRLFTYIVTDEATTRDRNTISGLRGNLVIISQGAQLNPCPTTTPCDNLGVAVIVSHGPNGHGAFYGAATALPTTNATSEEAENADATNLSFYDDPYTQNGFDDRLTWFKPSDLLQPLIASGAIRDYAGYNNLQFERYIAELGRAVTPIAGCFTTTSVPAITDAWGENLEVGSLPPSICSSGGTSGNPFKLESKGFNRTAGDGDDQKFRETLTEADLFQLLQKLRGTPPP